MATRPLEDFIRALRDAEVRVSVAETLDAHRVVGLLGFQDRAVTKDALAVTLAKSADEKTRFDDVFERFFSRDLPAAPDDAAAETANDPVPAGATPESAADGDAGDAGDGRAPADLADMLMAGDQAGLAAAMEAAAAAVGVGDIRSFMQRGVLGRRMLDAMGLRELERRIAALDAAGEAAAAEALNAGRRQLLADGRAFVERQYELYGRAAGEHLRDAYLETRALGQIDRRDMDRAQNLVRQMARKLVARHSRRQRRARRGRLDIRRTLRVNMAHDAVPFEVIWKQRKITRPKIVAVCDVSQSVATAARFLLMFLYQLRDVVDDVHAFAFSSHLMDVGAILDDHPIEEAIPQILAAVGFRPTDYGQALVDLTDHHLGVIDRRTTVIMLGDGRSNYGDPRIDRFRALHDRARRVVWLNTEPQNFWGLGDSEMPRYRPFCHVARTCRSLADLERVIDDLLRVGRN